MANHASAEKRQRQILKQTERNRHVRTTVRSCVKRARAAIAAGDKGAAEKALRVASEAIDKAVSKGVYHRRTGSRYISRLAQGVAGL
ncbi:MAG: 30S ribosomal protein S20 [Deltaproteobacteria bacterium]|nr:30S ribosomal protein S20 [Deltaproteobacteria bacterium]